VIPEAVLAALVRLRERPDTLVTLVSGRTVETLRRLVGDGFQLIGVHGSERFTGGVLEIHPSAAAVRPAIAELVEELHARSVEGMVLEDKGFSISLHTRQVSDAEEAARLEAEALTSARHLGLAAFAGKRVVEVRAANAPHKGDGILSFWPPEHRADCAAVFAGDDLTDEDGFRAVEAAGGIGVLVAEASRPTAASVRLQNPQEVLSFLQRLADRA
jgi:trehalose 6-phosphate phosphatase